MKPPSFFNLLKSVKIMYTDLDTIKRHLNVDSDFYEDDMYICDLMDVAEKAVEREIDTPLSQLEDDNGNIPQPLVHAMLLMVGNFYANRESISYASSQNVPYSYQYLCDLYRNYNRKDGV